MSNPFCKHLQTINRGFERCSSGKIEIQSIMALWWTYGVLKTLGTYVLGQPYFRHELYWPGSIIWGAKKCIAFQWRWPSRSSCLLFGPLESIACHVCKLQRMNVNNLKTINMQSNMSNWLGVCTIRTSSASNLKDEKLISQPRATSFFGDPWPRICHYAKCPPSCWKLFALSYFTQCPPKYTPISIVPCCMMCATIDV